MRSYRKKAFTMVYAVFAVLVLMAFASFAVDWGRVQTAKTELQNATDAAARYAVTGLIDNSCATKAIAAAGQNSVDSSPLVLTTADVTIGAWDSTLRVFTAGGSAHNAVKVIGHRIAARGTAIPLVFAKTIGRSTCDINTTSVATQPTLPYSMVALSGITMSGTSTIQRKASEVTLGTVIVASNGVWSLGGGALISGDALYRTTAPTGNITGNKTAMSSDVSYAVQAAPGGLSNLGPLSYTSGSLTNISGTYLCSACTLGGSFVMTLSGDLTLYCSGNCAFSGNVSVTTNGYKMTVYETGSGTISFTNNLPVTVVVYGPASTMTVNALGKVTGSFVASALNMSGGTVEYTSALPIPVAPSGGGSASAVGAVSMVK